MTLSQRAVEAALKAYRDEARDGTFANRICMEAALTAYHAALAVDGLCLAPVEPTESMIKSGQSAIPGGHGQAWLYAAGAYHAMLSAASDGDSPPAGTEG